MKKEWCMNGKLLCMLSIICCMQADENNLLNVEKLITKQNHKLKGQQEVRVTEKANLSTCSVHELIQYMMWASDDQVRGTFTDMPLQAKLVFLKQMNIEQYSWFLFAFTKKQWHQMWQKLPKDQQKTMPPTWLEQLKMIRDVWLVCSSGDIANYAYGKRDGQVQDVAFWRDKALQTIERLRIPHRQQWVDITEKKKIFYKWLDNRFQSEKLALLKEFSA